jgi:hypothetical protein
MERRDFIQGLVAGSVTVLAASSSRAAELGADGAGTVPDSVAPLFEPLEVGDRVGLGWSVTGLTEVKLGAAVLVLAHESGREARVHVCLRDGAPVGVAHSAWLDFLVMNDAGGSDATDESLARVLRTLAELARRNERRGAAPPEALESHDVRLREYRQRSALV